MKTFSLRALISVSSVLIFILTLSQLTKVHAQSLHAFTTTGGVVGWGGNSTGQTTIPVGAQSGVTAIAAGGGAVLALKSDGSVIGWGDNSNGQATIPVGALSGVTAIAAGGSFALALKGDGSVIGWGNNTLLATIPVGAQSGVMAISAGFGSVLALKSDGSVISWGNNTLLTTIPVGAQSGVTAIAAGPSFALALKSDGSVIGWGDNTYQETTIPLGAQSGVTAIAAAGGNGFGGACALALKSDGSVIGWGTNTSGQTTIPVGAQSGVTAIAAGPGFTLALKSDESVIGWGDNSAGETTPHVGAQSGAIAIAAGGNPTGPFFSLALIRSAVPTATATPSTGTNGSITLNANGFLAVTAPANTTVAAIAGAFTSYPVPLTITDTRIAPPTKSFHVQVAQTNFTNGTTTFAPGGATSVVLDPSLTAAHFVITPIAALTTTPQTLFSFSGTESFTSAGVTLSLDVTPPPGAIGTFTSTLTVSIVDGP